MDVKPSRHRFTPLACSSSTSLSLDSSPHLHLSPVLAVHTFPDILSATPSSSPRKLPGCLLLEVRGGASLMLVVADDDPFACVEAIFAAQPATTRATPTPLSVDPKGERIAYAVRLPLSSLRLVSCQLMQTC